MNNRVVSEPDFDIFGQYTEGFDAYSSLRNGSHPASSSVQNGSYPASSSVQNGSLPASSSVQDGPYPASSSVQNGSHPFPETSNQEPPSTPSQRTTHTGLAPSALDMNFDHLFTPSSGPMNPPAPVARMLPSAATPVTRNPPSKTLQSSPENRTNALKALGRMATIRSKLAAIREPAFNLTEVDKFITCGIAYLLAAFSVRSATIVTKGGDYQTEVCQVLEALVDIRGVLSRHEGTTRQFGGLPELDKLIVGFVRYSWNTVPAEWKGMWSN